jgi:hypothetical protein
LGDKYKTDCLSIDQEVSAIQRVLRRKGLDVISISLPSIKLLNEMNDIHIQKSSSESEGSEKSRAGKMARDDLFESNLTTHLTEHFSEISYLCGQSTSIGLDLNTGT